MPGDGWFGHYQLLRLLGQGGMGQVWLAHDTHTDRDVALKVLPPHLMADAEYRRRFEREARLAARLGGPHLVPIHTFGELDGHLFIDMEFVAGVDLSDALSHGPMPLAGAVDLVTQIATALDSAHSAGLIHRDVKPSNVVVLQSGFAYLIDFGIARADDQTALTTTGSAVGTLAYMAPERFTGSADARSDVYSLACVFYELLTGARPFAETDPVRQMHAHLMTPAPRVSALNAEVPSELDAVILQGMAKDPADRFHTAGEFASAAASIVPAQRWTPPMRSTRPRSAPSAVTQSDTDPASRTVTVPATGGAASTAAGSSPPRGRRPLVLAAVGALLLTAAATGTYAYVRQDDSANAGTAASPSVTATSPAGPAIHANTPRKVVATIPVGNKPQGIAVDPGTYTAYIGNGYDYAQGDSGGSISIIDTRANTVTGTIELANYPSRIVVDTEAHLAYVTAWAPSVKVTPGTDDSVPLGGSVTVIDTRTNKVTATITVGRSPDGIAVDTSRRLVYVANRGTVVGPGCCGSISVIDARTNMVISTITPKELPADVAVNPTNGQVYIAQYVSNSMGLLESGGKTVDGWVGVGSTNTVVLDTKGDYAYALTETGLIVINTRSGIYNGSYLGKPQRVAVDLSTKTVFVTGQKGGTTVANGNLYLIDTVTGNVAASVEVGRGAGGVAVDPTTHIAYVANEEDNTVSVIAPG